MRAALLGLKKIYRQGYAYKKAGVMLMGLSEAQMAQGLPPPDRQPDPLPVPEDR
jgi:DNA polymerase V